jgi:threonine aldolase
VCLSKGLGAPVGSVLCGSKDLIEEARRWRKVLGGGMRQAGILAAACIYVLENNIERLAEDHANAALLGKGLAEIEELEVPLDFLHTNMVFFSVPDGRGTELSAYLEKQGILVDGRKNFRLVTHLDISKADIEKTVKAIKTFFA